MGLRRERLDTRRADQKVNRRKNASRKAAERSRKAAFNAQQAERLKDTGLTGLFKA